MENEKVRELLLRSLMMRRRLSINYHGEERTVEVHAVGVSTKGNPCVRVFQVVGGAVFGPGTGWKMLKLSDIDNPRELPEIFDGPREGYQKGDKGMSRIYAEL